jgi:glutaredoxin 3
MVKEFLSQKGFTYAERNVSTDEAARNELRAMGYAATPVTVIAGEKIIGYNRKKIEAALAG